MGALLKHFGCYHYAIDFASDLNPDVIGALPSLPVRNGQFDIVCAFEVLEHIPLDQLSICLREMRRCASERVLLSVPDQSMLHPEESPYALNFGNGSSRSGWDKSPLTS